MIQRPCRSEEGGAAEGAAQRPTSLSMSVLMTPDLANFAGNVHGGALLKLLDQVAYACATRYARSYVVTLSVDRVIFRAPIHVGELITFSASVNYTGRTSMEIGIRVDVENIEWGRRRHTHSSYFTMVAVDSRVRPGLSRRSHLPAKPLCSVGNRRVGAERPFRRWGRINNPTTPTLNPSDKGDTLRRYAVAREFRQRFGVTGRHWHRRNGRPRTEAAIAASERSRKSLPRRAYGWESAVLRERECCGHR